jgi:hypothetical protein
MEHRERCRLNASYAKQLLHNSGYAEVDEGILSRIWSELTIVGTSLVLRKGIYLYQSRGIILKYGRRFIFLLSINHSKMFMFMIILYICNTVAVYTIDKFSSLGW